MTIPTSTLPGFEIYRFECQEYAAALTGIIDPSDQALLLFLGLIFSDTAARRCWLRSAGPLFTLAVAVLGTARDLGFPHCFRSHGRRCPESFLRSASLRTAAAALTNERTLPQPRYFRSLGKTFHQACPGVPGARAAALVGARHFAQYHGSLRLLWSSRPPLLDATPPLHWVPAPRALDTYYLEGAD